MFFTIISTKKWRLIMAAIDTLNSNIQALDALIVQLEAKPAGVPEAQVQAAADALAAENAKLQALVTK